VLQEAGPISAGELGAATGLSAGAITTLVDRLERDGFVRRVDDPDDRRRVLVELTDTARQAVLELWGLLAEGEPWLLRLTADELRLLRDYLNYGTELNLKNAARVRALPRRLGARRRIGHPPNTETT
jgi:DNA-binding MarR family transcriptional regulator